MTTPFKILYDEYGRTGNRFFAYLEPIAWAICKQKRVVILFPEKILQHYDKLRNSSCVRLPLWGKGKLWWRIARKVFYYNHLAQAFYKTRLSEKLGFYAEWQDDILREPHEYWPKVKPQIQQLFTPNDDIKLPIDELFKKVKSGGGAHRWRTYPPRGLQDGLWRYLLLRGRGLHRLHAADAAAGAGLQVLHRLHGEHLASLCGALRPRGQPRAQCRRRPLRPLAVRLHHRPAVHIQRLGLFHRRHPALHSLPKGHDAHLGRF